jgi:hypothetical protein
LKSNQPTPLGERSSDHGPRRGLWIFHIEERRGRPRMWATAVDDVERRSVEGAVEFQTAEAAFAHLEDFIRQAMLRSPVETSK